MIAKSKPKKGALLAEGTYKSKVGSVTGKPNEADPKKIILGFKVDGQAEEVRKEVPFTFEEGTLLRKDTETILGRQLMSKEAENGLDLGCLVDRDCRVVVVHKSAAGGKPMAAVSLVLPVVQAD